MGKRTGKATLGIRSGWGSDKTIEGKIGALIKPDPETGCWLWTGPVTTNGYGTSRPHVFVYDRLVGPAPRGWHIHHRCGVKLCCNPKHMVALSPAAHAREHAQQRARQDAKAS